MTIFDLDEVREFAADLNARMDRCDNGEGVECATLDAALQHYAGLCCSFTDRVRCWGREVFAGRVEFDPKVEQVWLEEGSRLRSRAMEMWAHGQRADVPCYMLDGQAILQSALWNLHRLLKGWVTPKLAVGPSARQGLASSSAQEIQRRIASLPPLPANWRPDDLHQQMLYRMLRNS